MVIYKIISGIEPDVILPKRKPQVPYYPMKKDQAEKLGELI